MSVFEFRELIESMIPVWVMILPLLLVLIYAIVVVLKKEVD